MLSDTTAVGKNHKVSLYRADSGALVFGAGTVQWSWGLDGVHDRGGSTEDSRMQQATVNLFADMGVQPGTLQSGLVSGAASSDTLPPSSVIGFPISGASLPSGNTVNIQGTAADTGGGVVAGVEVSVDGGTTWQAAIGTTNWSFAWTPSVQGTITIKSRAFDDTGNLEPTGSGEGSPNVITVNVTAPAAPTCPCSIFGPLTVGNEENDSGAVELGVKFRSDITGYITGIRFYKTAGNIGTHTGTLWSSAGVNLATATFSGETSSGWQEVLFDTPVAVTANATYVASYHTTSGHYATGASFAAAGVDNTPLHALQDGFDGPNGVYAYGGGGVFPTTTYASSNYLVDVVFETSVGPDVTPPTVTTLAPADGASTVSVNAAVSATFNEAIDPLTVDGTTFELRDSLNAIVPATVTYLAGTRTAKLTPASSLAYSSVYTATIRGGGTDPRIKDIAGNALASDRTWSFTTADPPPPPPTEGPGGPILVVSSAANPFSRYFAEILRAEGLNEFTAMDISLVTPAVLNNYDVVILGEMPIDSTQATMFSDWTNAGGTFIAMRPDTDLDTLLGITPAAGTLADKYLLINTASGPGVGIVNQTIQYHGTADLYTLNGATAIATLYSDALTPTSNPAVTTIDVGPNGGKAIAYSFDLARSVVYTRQGNPAWSGDERDTGAGGGQLIRSDDLFFGAKAGDVQPDWVDLNKVQIPQADEQQRLLANAITLGIMHRKPLPRFWYLPKGLKAAVVMTGDDHGNNGTTPQFDWDILQSPSGCSVADWECVRGTSYMYTNTPITNSAAAAYQAQGFELGLHVTTDCGNWTSQSNLSDFYTSQLSTFAGTFPGLTSPATNRTHCIAWSDWATQPKVEYQNGIRYDTNYYYWPDQWIQNRPGHFTGSGMPMRFADLDGTMIDVYQSPTQMTDESGIDYSLHINTLLDNALDSHGYYGVVTTNMHTDTGPHPGQQIVVNAALARSVPVVSAKQMLTWLDGRNNSSFANMNWSGDTLSFDITSATGSRNMRAMLPANSAAGPLGSLTQNGIPVAFTTQTIKGISYAFFPAPPPGTTASFVAIYTPDTTPPVISSVVANIESGTSVTITWTTDEASDSRVDFGTSSSLLDLNATSSALVTSHSLNLGGLTPGQTYYFRVTSADASTNTTTEPITANAPLSFTMPTPPCFVDDTTVDFGAGSTGASTYVSDVSGGEVSLASSSGVEFDGSIFPASWAANPTPWNPGGSVTVSNGQMVLDQRSAATTATFGPGSSVEFSATFGSQRHQHFGFVNGVDFNGPWVLVSTGVNGDGVYARSDVDPTGVLLGTALQGSAHRYRIVWNANSFDFYVDGASSPAATLNYTVAGPLNVGASDLDPLVPLAVDWAHVSPYASSGTFTSRVFGSTTDTTWGAVIWNSTVPSGTSIAIYARTGDTPIPDGTWSSFALVPASGTSLGVTSKYIQYRADLATSDPSMTPLLNSVSISCDGISSSSGPVISNVLATPGTNGTTATISWDTDVPSTTRVDYGTSGGALSSNVSDGNLVTSHSIELTGLTSSSAYDYRVTSVDGLSVSSSSPIAPGVLTFNTPFSYNCPCSIWDNTGTPANPLATDNQPIEVGTKFRSSQAGFITALKYYRGSGETDTHVGHLRASNGTLLATVTFSGETASGWQEMALPTPVPIAANTTYIASIYSSPTGHFAYTVGGLTTAVNNPPLRALADLEDGHNGVYQYGGGFPTLGSGANYWVDAVFDTTDFVPPAISNVVATPGVDGTTATITWTTDEPASSEVLFGVTSGGLVSNGVDHTLVTNHSVVLTGLNQNTTYYYRVSSSDASSNSAEFPVDPATNTFFTAFGSFTDSNSADFSAGSGCAVDPSIGDGAVLLPATVDETFNGSTVPNGWTSTPWSYQPGGSSIVNNGSITIDESLLSTNQYYLSGRVLDFVATFQPNALQHAGFAVDYDSSANWAAFSMGSPAGTVIKARTNVGGSQIETDTAATVGVPHHFRIQWSGSNIVFYIDDMTVPVATHTVSFGSTQLRPAFSDLTTPGQTVDHSKALVLDWVRMTPYQAPCTFTSRIFDAGSSVNWEMMSWNRTTPANTSLAMSYRIGNSPSPDASWSGFVPASVSPATLGGTSRYIQYQAVLATADSSQTPTLTDVNITYSTGSDSTAPTIVDRDPANNAINVSTSSNVTVTFSEPMLASTITTSNFRLRRNGDGADTPATLLVSGNSATLDPTVDLQNLATYTVTIDTGMTDVSGNPLAPETWVFTTAAPIVSATDTTTADFAAGTTDCTIDGGINDGALRQTATVEENFNGSSLPTGWSSGIWPGGGNATVSGGSVTVDGARAFTTASFSPGTSLQFRATFTNAQFQYAGFATDGDINAPWMVIGQGNSAGAVYARRDDGGDVLLSSTTIGTPHIYRIDWTPTGFDYYIDGVFITNISRVISSNMVFIVSDYNAGGNDPSIDWVRITPYVTPCTFTSRVIDAGSVVDWLDLTSTGSTPTGTSVGFETRSGDTAIPDGTWSAFQAVNSPIASPNSRYIQYRATLANTDSTQTPVVESVNITYQNQPTFTVTYDGNGQTGGTAPVDGTAYAFNTPVTVASPGSLVKTGYTFVGWNTAANGSGTAYAVGGTFNIVASTTLYAQWTIISYPISVTAGSNGSISPIGPVLVNYGGSQAFTIAPDMHYHIADVLIDGISNAGAVSSGTYTFTNVMTPHSIEATFAINTYTLTYAAGAGGSIMGTSPQTVDYNTSGSLVTATPDTGYHFVDWSDGLLTASRTDDNVMADISVTANFAINTYTLTYIAGTGGTITGTSPQMVNHGSSGTQVTAVPDAGYHFVDWSDSSTVNPRTDINVIGPITVTANFERDPSATVYVDDDWSGVVNGNDPDGGGPATIMGYDGFSTIQDAVASVADGGTVIVYAGNYSGDVDVTRTMEIRGSFTLSGHLNASVPDVIVSQGTNPGVINSGGLTLSTGTTLKAKINGTVAGTQYDTVNVTGSVDLGNSDLSLTVGFTPSIGQSYTLIANDGSDPVIGTFNGLVEGSTIAVGPDRFVISYTGGDGNDVVLTSVAFSNTLAAPTMTSLTNVPVTIPITTTELAGAHVLSADLTLTYNTSVLNTATFSATAGTVSAGSTVTVDASTPGTLIVSVSRAPGLGEFSGTGTIVNITADVIGTIGASTPLTLTNVKLNNGLIPASGTNGSLTVRSGMINGQVSYALAPTQKVANTMLDAPGSPARSATTDSNGQYSLSGFGPGSYTVTPSRPAELVDQNNGIFINDAALIAQHVVGLITLTPDQIKAAKVSGLPTLSSFDAALIAQYTVGISNGINQTGRWKFDQPSVNYGVVTSDLNNQNYRAFLLGDVDGSWLASPPPPLAQLSQPTKNSVIASVPFTAATPKATINVPFRIDNLQGKTVGSYQFTLEYDPGVIEAVPNAASVLGTNSESLTVISNSPTPGVLKVAVYGALPVSGDGVYVNLRFAVTGGPGSVSPLNIVGFRFNNGVDEVYSQNGGISVVASSNKAVLTGRTLSAGRSPVGNARITLTGSDGIVRSTTSNPFGYFEFSGLSTGETYTIEAASKRFVFVSRSVVIDSSAVDIELVSDQ